MCNRDILKAMVRRDLKVYGKLETHTLRLIIESRFNVRKLLNEVV